MSLPRPRAPKPADQTDPASERWADKVSLPLPHMRVIAAQVVRLFLDRNKCKKRHHVIIEVLLNIRNVSVISLIFPGWSDIRAPKTSACDGPGVSHHCWRRLSTTRNTVAHHLERARKNHRNENQQSCARKAGSCRRSVSARVSGQSCDLAALAHIPETAYV